MFRTFRRKWWKLNLTLARAWARRTNWLHLEPRHWWGKLATSRPLLLLWLFGAVLFAGNAFLTRVSTCGFELAEIAATSAGKENVEQTGSVGQSLPAASNSRSTEVKTEPSDTTPQTEVSRAAGAPTLPSVWGIRVIDPSALQDGWISGKYLAREAPQVQAGLPQQPAQPAAAASAISDQPEPSPAALKTSTVSDQPEPSATPTDLRKQRASRRRHTPRFRYERGFYPTW